MRSCPMPQPAAQLLHHRHFAVPGGQPHDGRDLAAFRIVAESRADDVIGRDHTFQRGLHDLFRRGGNHVSRKIRGRQIC